jgi:hypothetical protein
LASFLAVLEQISNEFSTETALFGALKSAFPDGIPHVVVPLCLRLASILGTWRIALSLYPMYCPYCDVLAGRQHIKVSTFLLSHAAGLMTRKQILTCWHQQRLTSDSEAMSSPFEISRDLQSEFTKFEHSLSNLSDNVVVVQLSLSLDGLHIFLTRCGTGASPLVIRLRLADDAIPSQSIDDMIDTFDDMELSVEPAQAAKKKTTKIKAVSAPASSVVKPKSSRREVSRNAIQASNGVESSSLHSVQKPVSVVRKNVLTEVLVRFSRCVFFFFFFFFFSCVCY